MTKPEIELSPAKRALREARLRGQYRAQPLTRRAREGDPPLSFAQERLWFVDRLQPGSTAFNLNAALRLSGDTDEGALERALGEIVRRHEALRTTLREVDGMAVQSIAPFVSFTLPIHDLSRLDEAAREAEVRRRAAAERAHVFDLAAGPLFRASLLRLGGGEHHLLLCAHHVVHDVWSQHLLLKELRVLHDAFRDGRASPLPEPAIQYADYAAWQRAEGRAGEGAHLAWWKRRLAGAPELLALPTDRPRPPVPSLRGARVPVEVSAEVLERLRRLALAEGATLHMVVLAAFQLLLSRYAGSDDVSVGSPVAGRMRREMEELIGLFVNTVVLRTDLSGDPTLRALVGRVRETALGAYQHQDVPFERVVAEVKPERSLSHSLLFQVMFLLDDGEHPPLGGDGAWRRVATAEPEATQFDLTLSLAARPEGLAGVLEYGTDLFERATMERMAAHLARVLERLAYVPDARLSEVELLSEAERREIVEGWNATGAPYPAGRCIHHLFEAQAARAPDAVAVVCEGERVTYAALNERANRLARHLRRRGVGPEARVGIRLERGPELVAALLAVLKAGGAYVPLDPAHPTERLAFTLADSGVAVLVTQESLRGALPATDGLVVVSVDGAARAEIAAAEGDGNPPGGAGPRNLAYLIYTSGSTGVPKGVAIEHESVVALLSWAAGVFSADELSGVLASTSISFDLSVFELFLPLSVGGRAVLVDNALALARSAAAGEVRLVNTVPSAIAALLESGAIPPGVATVNLAGEPLRAELADALYARGVGRVHDLYGPSEDTVYSTWALRRAGGPATIGTPVSNTRAYVLDGAMRPVPVGVAGELYLGGRGLARGYLGRPGLTAERFVPDSFGAEGGGRLYRTGDRARWRADGTLEYLGRLDEQVKIRGHRIEPGEIEAVLRRHEGVRDCVVVAREDAPGEKRLAAYVVGGADADALRAHLRRSLPEYMVPAAFVSLDALPLTSNGKVDRGALPAPGRASPGERHVEPRTPVEALLADIWAELLRVERVGVRDGFFELGGDSILSIQVVSRARRAGLDLTPRRMVEYQTIAELAAVVGRIEAPAAPAAEQGRVEGRVEPTPVQAWFLEQEQPAPWHFNQALWLEVDASLTDAVLEAALAAVLERHDALRLRFRRTTGGWEEWHAAEHGITLERVDLSHLPPDARGRARDEAAAERHAGLDLERGPLGRAVLFDAGEGGRELLLVLHHLVVDGVSWPILRDDLERACALLQAGEKIDLGPKTTSYRAWAETLRRFAGSEEAREEADYWRAQGPEGVAPLPVDGDGGRTMADARAVTVRLDAAETRALLHEAPAAYRTQASDVLLCALAEAVGAWSGSPRVRVALEGHGREEEVGTGVDLTRTVGWFTSVYPVVLDAADAVGPGERLKGVKEQLRAVPRRGLGYGVLRHLSSDGGVRAALAAHPEPEIAFVYLGQPGAGLPADARLRPLDGRPGHGRAPENRRPHALTVEGAVEDGCLRISWTYGEGPHHRETIERLAEAHLRALRVLVAHCREAGAGGYTPSDFPLAELALDELDALLGGRRGVEDLYPLSPLQEGILFHTLSGGEPQPYQVQTAWRLEGRLDEALFRRAWDEVAARHAVLRTAFAWRGLRAPLQRVESAVRLPWTVEDWRGRAPDERDAALERFLAEDRARGFALEEAPLTRYALLRVEDEARWFVWNQHHLLMDRWTFAAILAEVLELYRAWSAGEAARPGHARRYRDYIAWLRRRDRGAAERYWRGVLAGFAAPTRLGGAPVAGPAGARYARLGVALPVERTARLEEAARRMRVTLNTVVQGAWGLLLSRYGGEEDVVFGVTVSGRPPELAGVEEMAGLFINAIPLRVRVRGDARLGAWLGELQRAQVEAREHEYAPLVEVQRWSDVPPGTPLFESLLAFKSHPGEPGANPSAPAGLRLSEARTVEWTNYPLTLGAEPGPELRLSLSYDERRFDADAVERMLRHLERLLEEFADGADARLSELELLSEAERRRVVEEWNATGAAYPRDCCIHELFEARAARTPGAVAVVSEAGSLSRGELNARANRLARHLRRLGVGPDTRVALCLERGPEMVVGLLAVLKAGGAYVPLDPSDPAERLRFVLADSAPAVVLTREMRGEGLAAPFISLHVPVVAVDGDAPAWADESAADLERAGLTVDHLAYVIYTSGSTGRPKGVMNAHRGVVNRMCWMQERFGLGEGDAVLQKTPYSFDVSVWELFWPLIEGARLVMARPDGHRDPAYLVETIRRERVTTVHFVPSMLRAFLEHPDAERATGLLRVVCSGEALPPAVVERFHALLPRTELHNLYGPTEAAVDVTAWHCAPGATGPIPIGQPMANTRTYVLDAAGAPVPVGVAGELYIGGIQVARGYLGRPGLTAERFVADPFSREPGARLYRTGDLGRWLADGTIEYLGRTDFQVKVRGHRIEPGEIESRLAEHPSVREAVVTAREDAAGEVRLVAYCVADEVLSIEALRSHLSARLPEHMVPAAYVRLEALPLTPSGKLDRGALPAPDGDAYAAREFEAPAGEAEEALAEIWTDVLGVERVGRWDHFFELGGHSLHAVRVVSRVRRVLEVDASPGDLFVRPVLADFARGLETAARAELPPIEPAPAGERLALSFAQQRLWFLDRLGGAGATYHIPLRLRLEGRLDAAALGRALDRIVARHEALRTTFARADGEPVQRIAPAEESRFHLLHHDFAGHPRAEAELRRLVAEEAAAPFDLERGPLVRGRLARMAAEDHVLLVTMHHVVSDGWSMGVLEDELSALYGAFASGEADPLPPLPVQYADYAAWQRRWVAGDVLRRQADYWRETLAGAPELLELPADRARPAWQDHAGAAVALELDEALTAGLKALARRHGTTLYMTLLAGWATVLSRLSGQDDVVVGTPTANRGRGEVEGLIGFFVNTLAVRLDLSGSPTVSRLLARVKERALAAQHHQDIPFEQVVELVRPARSLAHAPLFQVMFAWENTPRGRLRLPGLTPAPVERPEHRTARFDLSLALSERDGRIAGGVEYATALFDGETVERWLGYLRRALEAMVADDRREADGLPLLSEAERSAVEEWNATAAEYPRDLCIHRLFEARAERDPRAAAVVFEAERATYAELNARANRLAHHLRGMGVGPDARVAICAERGVEMLVAVLAVLKAGGAYVPLDPTYPVERLRYMLADSAPAALLALAPPAGLVAGLGVPVLDLAADAGRWAGRPETNPGDGDLTPGHLAYVIYTSGSTGAPKGVAVPHRGVVNVIGASISAFGVRAGDRVAQLASLSFDASVLEIFTALCSGAALVLAPRDSAVSGDALEELFRREGVTHLVITPSRLEHLSPDAFPSLRTVVIGGEAATAELARRWAEGRALFNAYATTETTVYSTLHPCPPGAERAPALGRPIANTRVHVLDARLRQAPIGAAGELYVGGAGVARGYLGRPRLTAERFVPDPFGGEPGARLYRTGDLGRRLADGTLEFLGRNDFQVKVRGFRVEPGEIEARLAEHPGVREVVVLAREDVPGDRRLVAYFAGAEEVRAETLRAHLSTRLPEHMAPAAYVRMDRLPLLPTGKPDRKALPAPGGDAYASPAYVPPEGETEEALAELWSELLGVERVGRHDNFFALGGHSLRAVTLTERMRRRGLHAPVRALFTTRTLAELAAAVGGEAPEVRIPENLITAAPAEDTHSLRLSL